jgi:sulfur carrier protein
MKVIVNDENYHLCDNSSLLSLLESLEISSMRGWAIAVNEKVIAHSEFENFFLQEGDRILLIQATQGG